ncbi:MAG TPA: adenosine deaminase [Firmicutes bacterium]|nr:adenosine deaminase [Candidatus Fermentithermobacillaceae bacterium]
MSNYSNRFMSALARQDLASIRQVPKSDLHNHFVLGGSRDYIFQQTGIKIPSLDRTLHSMQDMHEWCGKHIGLGHRFDTFDLHKVLLEAAFYQAKEDGVKILEIGEDAWANAKYYGGDVSLLVDTFFEARKRIAPCTELRLQIGLSRHCPVSLLEKWLEPFWGRKEFYSIDLSGDELAQPIENFAPVYRRAKSHGLQLKAHIGEWGTAEDIVRGVELLELDEVQHGIAAAGSQAAMDYLVENKVRLNICPRSNVKLGRVDCMKNHPIRVLFRHGVDVTINSDDVLVFDSDVSKEYLRLYRHGVLSADELDAIRLNGLGLG